MPFLSGSFLLASVASMLSGAQVQEPPSSKQNLSVLYAGCQGSERETRFVAFLREHFTNVGTTTLFALTKESACSFDVVVADWVSRYTYEGGKAKSYDASSDPNARLSVEFTKPVVMIGAVGGHLADWSKIGWL